MDKRKEAWLQEIWNNDVGILRTAKEFLERSEKLDLSVLLKVRTLVTRPVVTNENPGSINSEGNVVDKVEH